MMAAAVAYNCAAFRITGRHTVCYVRLRSTTSPHEGKNNSVGDHMPSAKSFDDIPGPDTGFFKTLISVTVAMLTGRWHKQRPTITQMRRDYGPIWKQKFGSLNMVAVTDPKLFEDVLRNEGKYPKRMPFEPWIAHRDKRRLAQGVLLQEGPDWHRHRAALNKRMMRPADVASYSDTINDVTNDLIQKVIRAKKFSGNNIVPNIENILFNWSLDTGCAVIFNKKLNLLDDEPRPEAQSLIQAVHDMFESTLWLYWTPVRIHRLFNSRVWRKHVNAWDTIFATAKELIDEKMNDVTKRMAAAEDIGIEGADLVTYMITKGTLSVDEIYANATELLAATVDTTANTMLWTLYCFAKHPRVQDALYEETERVVPRGETPTHEHVNQMPYLKAIVRESMRLYPPIANLARILDKDISVGGYQIPAGTAIVGQMWLMSRDPKCFSDPLEFRPERWIRVEKEHFYGFKSLPFGYGPRMCIGKRLAELEIHLTLARLCQNFILTSTTDVKVKMTTLALPDRPLNLKFIDRRSRET